MRNKINFISNYSQQKKNKNEIFSTIFVLTNIEIFRFEKHVENNKLRD